MDYNYEFNKLLEVIRQCINVQKINSYDVVEIQKNRCRITHYTDCTVGDNSVAFIDINFDTLFELERESYVMNGDQLKNFIEQMPWS